MVPPEWLMISVIALIFLWGFSKRITEQGGQGQGQGKEVRGQESGLGEEREVRVRGQGSGRKTRSQTDLMPASEFFGSATNYL